MSMSMRFPKPYLGFLSLACCLVFCVQCGGDAVTPEEEPVPLSVSKEIGQDGGELALGDEAWVIIPAGALDSTVTITLAKVEDLPNPAPNYILQGSGYSFTPHGYDFNSAVAIGIAYDTTFDEPSLTRLDDEADIDWAPVPDAQFADGFATFSSLTFSIMSVTDFQPLEDVYVSNGSQGPNPTGMSDDPLSTISAGIAVSLGAGEPYPPVLVAVGTYEESLVFEPGVSIHGGLDAETWEWSEDSYSLVIVGAIAASATEITSPTDISGLELRSLDVTAASTSSIALRVIACGDSLRFLNCRFQSGNGADGSSGEPGSAGADGGRGGDAGTGYGDHHYTGGAGGSGALAGGRGGDGSVIIPGFPGFAGYGAFCGGLGGSGAVIPSVALPGDDGGWGSNGANGDGGTRDGHTEIAGWTPSFAEDGTDGTDGCGGGGGGGGSHLYVVGMGGAGGGGGGSGGTRGYGGRGGGSSFAIYFWDSDPVFENCTFVTGNGGRGGNGGDGGNLGLRGEWGVSHGGTHSQMGARGGLGGYGGFGGSGGGGAGGNSICAYRVGNVCLSITFDGCQWLPGEAGEGGSGGQAVNDDLQFEGIPAPDGESGLAIPIGP